MESPTPANLSDALDQAATGKHALPLVYLDKGKREALVALAHRDGEQSWLVAFRLTAASGSRGQWRAFEFAVKLCDPPDASGMTSREIRALPIGELLATARKALSGRLDERPKRNIDFRVVSISDLYLAPFLKDARGRAPRDDTAYAGLAFVYAGLVEEGDRSPAKTLAAQHGGTSGTWANRVAEARRRGLLTAVKPGEAGGGMTDKVIDLLYPNFDAEAEAQLEAQLAEGDD